MKVKVYIEEHLVKTVEVEANDHDDALEKVEKDYKEGKIVLTADDFHGNYSISTDEIGWMDAYK